VAPVALPVEEKKKNISSLAGKRTPVVRLRTYTLNTG
jgi:hypothetical protein